MEQLQPLEQIIVDIGKFLTGAVGWMGEIANFVMDQPIVLLLAVVVPLSGWAISGLRRLINLN